MRGVGREAFGAAGENAPRATVDLAFLREFTAVPGALILPQDRTERILCQHASRAGLTDVRFGHRLIAFDQDDSGVTIRVRPRRGAIYERTTEYLIGCDGAHCAVREALGWPLEGKTYPTRFLLADVRLPDHRNDLPWPRFAPMREEVLFAIRFEPELWRIIASVAPRVSEGEATREPEIARRVELLFGPGPFELIWADVFRIHCRNSPHFRQDRVLLAGDAAHINSPAGGMGMNSGIQDAHNLGWKLARAVRGGEREPLLASYEEERREAVLTNVDRYTDALTRGASWRRVWSGFSSCEPYDSPSGSARSCAGSGHAWRCWTPVTLFAADLRQRAPAGRARARRHAENGGWTKAPTARPGESRGGAPALRRWAPASLGRS